MKGCAADYSQSIVKKFRIFTLLCVGISLQAEIHLSKNEEYSQEQAMQYCRDLGPKWRALGIKEIYALPKSTPYIEGYSYWSSTTISSGDAIIGTGSEGDGGIVEILGFSFYPKERNVTFSPRWKKIAAICTNDPLPPKLPNRFKKTLQGTFDPKSNIIWHNLDATDKRAKYTYAEAEEMCENLNLYGRSWRLPTTDELYGIVDYSFVRPTLDMTFFGPVMHRYYWSSDSLNEKEGYVVGFKLGSVATAPKKESTQARCVSDSD